MSKRFLLKSGYKKFKDHPDLKNLRVEVETDDDFDGHIRCPVHDDGHPSLMIYQEQETFHCYGCGWSGTAKQIEGIFSYIDRDGNLLFQVLRLHDKGLRKTFVQRKRDGDDWIYEKGDSVLYNLPRVLECENVFIVEGEGKAYILNRAFKDEEADQETTATTAPGGASVRWKKKYSECLKGKNVFVLADNDDVGETHALDICQNLKPVAKSLRLVGLPGLDVKEDVADWLEHGHTLKELVELAVETPEWEPDECEAAGVESEKPEPEEPEIDVSQFEPLSVEKLTEILGLTIVRDNTNKLVTFLCLLTAFTDDCQFNTSLNAPSSTGKSYIPLEIDKLFPDKDVMELGYCSPMSFFHDYGKWDKDKKVMVMDLERKIIIFIDQPHTILLERLRPILSHDRKEVMSKITDKTEKAGTRTKNLIIKGFPSVVFCSAGLKIDEQEITRFILLSPDMDQEKLKEAIHMVFQKEANKEEFAKQVEENPDRQALKLRIQAIKQAKVTEVRLHKPELAEGVFDGMNNDTLKPRHMRDAGRVCRIIKALALLNTWFRERDGSIIYTNDEDVQNGLTIWNSIAEPNDLNLPPYIFDIFKKVIEPLCVECDNVGIHRKDILRRHYQVFKKFLSDISLGKEIIPMLQTAGLIREEKDPNLKTAKLIFLT